MIRGLDDTKQVEGYRKMGVDVHKGVAEIVGPRSVRVNGEVHETERIVVATGSEPTSPPIPGLEAAGYWTNREATTLAKPPESVIVVGGGATGIELGQLLRRLGAAVTVLEAAKRLMPGEEPAVGSSWPRRSARRESRFAAPRRCRRCRSSEGSALSAWPTVSGFARASSLWRPDGARGWRAWA
jgi:pyruvate/2-oxoglutarate dehydrogenase complex dihydrolipoamide dehydrogenase (E3) component